jgi:pimeloyl-ACP methyl ester carboxylesterase
MAAGLELETVGDGPPVLFVHGDVVPAKVSWAKQRELGRRWRLLLPNRPGFGASPPLERSDFEAEAPPLAELLGDGAHLVGHSYGALIALYVAALRPGAVRSVCVSEPPALQLARGVPAVEEMIADGRELYRDPDSIPDGAFLGLFRSGVGSVRATPGELPPELRHGVALLKRERPPWDAQPPVDVLAEAGFPKLVISGGHSAAFEAVCDALAARIGAERAEVSGRAHSIPVVGEPYNRVLEDFLAAAEAAAA